MSCFCFGASLRGTASTRQQPAEKTDDPLCQPFQILVYSPQQLRKATKNFHRDRKLGQGGFGSVYKGTLRDGQEIAIKKLINSNETHGKCQFEAEVKTISSVRHRNLIRLFGYCVDGDDKYLIYEYLENLSLEKHLFEITGKRMSTLSWNTRKKILQGIAKGLSYLHHDLKDQIIHRDIKPANILLDEAMEAKIADFGLARFISSEQTHHSTMVAGTLPYIAPEVIDTVGKFSQRSDTYSFGVVALEILSGRKAHDPSLPADRRNLLDWAWMLYVRQQYTDVMDPLINGRYAEEEVRQLIWLALMCTQPTPERRPSMMEVLLFLESEKNRDVMGVPWRPKHAFSGANQQGEQADTTFGFHTRILKDNSLEMYSFRQSGR